MGGGGGGSTSVDMRNPKTEQKTVGNWYGFQQDQYGNFVANNPLLNAAQGGALDFWNQLPQMLSQFKGFGKEISGDQSQISGYQNQLGNLYGKLGGTSNRLGNWLQSQVLPTIASHGALTAGENRNIDQQTLAMASQMGNARSLGTLGSRLLNRKEYSDQRFNQALQQGQGLLGQQAGIMGQQGGLAQAGAGLTAMNAGLTGQKAGLLGQQQAMQTGGLNQLLGVGNAGVSQFTGLTNPVLSYLGNLFGGNQQASIAQAQINAQQQAASNAKAGSTAGGAISAVGSILPMLAMFSDKRLKQKIEDTGLKTEDDIPIKTFEYKARPGERMIGVIAQDVEKKNPDAVLTDFWSGLKLIDTSKVNIPMGKVA